MQPINYLDFLPSLLIILILIIIGMAILLSSLAIKNDKLIKKYEKPINTDNYKYFNELKNKIEKYLIDNLDKYQQVNLNILEHNQRSIIVFNNNTNTQGDKINIILTPDEDYGLLTLTVKITFSCYHYPSELTNNYSYNISSCFIKHMIKNETYFNNFFDNFK